MKAEVPNSRKTGTNRNPRGMGMSQLPMEWMDPLSWRLPSGKALAEFALQTGFLAPLLMRAPQPKRKLQRENQAGRAVDVAAIKSREGLEEAPARMATFRDKR